MNLFEAVVPRELWHPNFAALMTERNSWNEAVLADWACGFRDRDGKFVREFQTTFNSCFWELYLHAVLRERRCVVDFSFSSPDFVVTAPSLYCVEAVVANNAQDAPPEHQHRGYRPPGDLNELNRSAIIRLSNAIQSKYVKFKKQYGSLPHVATRPFVIAIAPFDRPHAGLQCQRAIEALLYSYNVDEEAWIRNGCVEAPVPKAELVTVAKDGGANIPHGLFLGDSMPEVSAIIFSSLATWGKVRALAADPNPDITFFALAQNMSGATPHQIRAPKRAYAEKLLDGLRVYHNRGAHRPLDPEIFRCDEVMQTYWAETEGGWIHEQREWQLLARRVFTHTPRCYLTQ